MSVKPLSDMLGDINLFNLGMHYEQNRMSIGNNYLVILDHGARRLYTPQTLHTRQRSYRTRYCTATRGILP